MLGWYGNDVLTLPQLVNRKEEGSGLPWRLKRSFGLLYESHAVGIPDWKPLQEVGLPPNVTSFTKSETFQQIWCLKVDLLCKKLSEKTQFYLAKREKRVHSPWQSCRCEFQVLRVVNRVSSSSRRGESTASLSDMLTLASSALNSISFSRGAGGGDTWLTGAPPPIRARLAALRHPTGGGACSIDSIVSMTRWRGPRKQGHTVEMRHAPHCVSHWSAGVKICFGFRFYLTLQFIFRGGVEICFSFLYLYGRIKTVQHRELTIWVLSGKKRLI